MQLSTSAASLDARLLYKAIISGRSGQHIRACRSHLLSRAGKGSMRMIFRAAGASGHVVHTLAGCTHFLRAAAIRSPFSALQGLDVHI